MIDDLKLIKYFTTLIDLESEVDTASRYNMSQAALHVAVKKLEELMGAVLYTHGELKVKSRDKFGKGKNTDRRRKYHLTPAGAIVYKYGQEYLKLDEGLMWELTALHHEHPPVLPKQYKKVKERKRIAYNRSKGMYDKPVNAGY